MKIAMIGTGYVGLVSGVCFSDFGHDVICVDKNAEKIAQLQAGQVPIFEPGLADLMAKNVQAGRLSFTLDLAQAVVGADAVFIAVGTPEGEDGSADLQHVLAEVRMSRLQKEFARAIQTCPRGEAHRLEENQLAFRIRGVFAQIFAECFPFL